MSIKSEKSLLEECSEIIEKSYSVRSASEESLSGRVEEVMRAAAAEEGIEFAETAPPPQDSLWLDEAGFVTSLDTIFGNYEQKISIVYNPNMFYHRSGVRKRVKNRWITDAIYLPYLMMSASDRSLTVYDAATLSHTPLYCITGLPNIPTTLYIWDLYEECLLQTIKLRFPFLGVLGKKVEFGPYCIHPGPVRKELEEETEESMLEEPIVMSRRASSVYQGSTGGLMLQLDMENEWDKKGLEDEPEYKRFNRCEILVSCCDFVCTVRLGDAVGAVVPPPADTLRARRPSVWDLPDYPATSTSSTTPRLRPSLAPTPLLLSPSTAEFPVTDLDTLLENAGICLMTNAVSAGAPYLALKTYDPCLVEPVDEMLDEYRRVMKLFPTTSITGTPTGSEKSTPRRSRSQKL
ncbi:hypothetical protein HF086_005259 [Spodoptera exigua]|uniref:Uncharacterized protein n=1 Tax=Spodoptera exigua TaxID=7107 RepID=A0A922MYN8_SPOEX|nr:hypothetical protein HF086_005259 [Spodoptera exigua]